MSHAGARRGHHRLGPFTESMRRRQRRLRRSASRSAWTAVAGYPSCLTPRQIDAFGGFVSFARRAADSSSRPSMDRRRGYHGHRLFRAQGGRDWRVAEVSFHNPDPVRSSAHVGGEPFAARRATTPLAARSRSAAAVVASVRLADRNCADTDTADAVPARTRAGSAPARRDAHPHR
jgi:hypothetical protein